MNPEHTDPDQARNGAAHLFPPIEPHASDRLAVGAGHSLYWEESGNPEGVPVVFLHGGPGAGAAAEHRRFFDPRRYRIVIFDQRGAGRSTPLGELERQHHAAPGRRYRAPARPPGHRALAGVRRLLGLDPGAGLRPGPSRARARPWCCAASSSAAGARSTGSSTAWAASSRTPGEAFLAALPAAERDDPLSDLPPPPHRPGPGGAPARGARLVHLRGRLLHPAAEPGDRGRLRPATRMALALARLEAHYFVNGCFLEEGQLLRWRGPHPRIPGVHRAGPLRPDLPAGDRRALAGAWPEAELDIVPDAGHAAMEPGIAQALVAATERFKTMV